jgi:hypothetical protein
LNYTSNLGMCVHKESWNSLNITDPNGTCCVTEMSQLKRLIPNSYNKSQQDPLFLNFISVNNPTCFRHILSINRRLDTIFTATGICHTGYVD